jgi:hypothetical protein
VLGSGEEGPLLGLRGPEYGGDTEALCEGRRKDVSWSRAKELNDNA